MRGIYGRRLAAAATAIAVVGAGAAGAAQFTGGAVTINDAAPKPTPASPYPAPVAVSGLLGAITRTSVKLNGLSHDIGDDVDALLTSPAGGKVLVMSDAGGSFAVSGLNLTLDDAAASALPDTTALTSGTFRPSNYGSSGANDPFCTGEPATESFPAPAPAPPYDSQLSVLNGGTANGIWNLFVTDDCVLGQGSLTSWTLDVVTGGQAFAAPSAISIVDDFPKPTKASPYPSTISVSGMVGPLTKATVTLNSLTHGVPDDIDALVVSPSGANVLVLSDAGGTVNLNNVSIVVDDAAASSVPPGSTIAPGTYRPSNYGSSGLDDPFCSSEPDPDSFPAPAPAPPYGTQLSAFNGVSPNGTWRLYLEDDCSFGSGTLNGGWSLALTTSAPTAVGVASFTSVPAKDRITLRWRTASERSIAGFEVFRSEPGVAKRRLPGGIVRAARLGTARGAAYRLVDGSAGPGISYTYHLRVVRPDGTRAWYGATTTRLLGSKGH